MFNQNLDQFIQVSMRKYIKLEKEFIFIYFNKALEFEI